MRYGIRVHIAVLAIGLTLVAANHALAQNRNKKRLRQADALISEKQSRTPIERKIDSQLLQAVREYQGKKMAWKTELEPANVYADKNGNLDVDISATVSDQLLSNIKALGGVIIFPSVQYHTIRARVSITKVEKIAALEPVRFIQPAVLPVHAGAAQPY
jgi:hypothetical protein